MNPFKHICYIINNFDDVHPLIQAVVYFALAGAMIVILHLIK